MILFTIHFLQSNRIEKFLEKHVVWQKKMKIYETVIQYQGKKVMGRRSYTEAFYLHIFSLGSLDGIKKNNNIILQSSNILVALQPSICCMIVVGWLPIEKANIWWLKGS